MVGSIDIRVNAARPNLPLCDLFAFQGSPSSIRVIDVPRSIGNWEITSVKLVVAYPNNMTVEKVATRVGNVWVSTVEGSPVAGKVENGYEVLADGVDERGNPVEGYVLGKGNVFVLQNTMDVSRLVNKFTVRYLKNLPEVPSVGDLVEFNGVMKLFDGHDWISMGGGGDVYDSTITIEKNGVEVGSFTTNASEATTIDIPVPSTTSELANDSGFITANDIPPIPSQTSDLTNDSGFITASAIPSTVSSFENDAGYITASAIPPIPSQTSDLVNDSGYITASAIPPIPSTTNDLVNDSGFITASAIPSQVSSFENDVGYITASQVQPATSAAFSGFAQSAFAAAQLNAYDITGVNDHATLTLTTTGNTEIRTEYFPSWYLSKYYDAEYSPSIEMVWTYIATISYKASGRTRRLGVNRWGWAGIDENGVRYFLTSTEEDQWAEDWTTGRFYKWTPTTALTAKNITLSSDKLSIETIDGLTDQITCTRTFKTKSARNNSLAFLSEIPSATSQLTNDSGFITSSAIPSNVGAFANDVGYLTASTMPPIPSQTSDLVNDSGFITLSAIPAIPSNTSDLENDSGFITSAALSGYATENYVDGKVLALSSIYALDSDLDLVVASVSSIQTSLSTFATTSYVDAQIGSINTILDNINGEVI